MTPTENDVDTQERAVDNSTTARLPLRAAYPAGRDARQRTDDGHRRSRLMSVRKAAISVGVIDEKSFTRECITKSLQALDDRLNIVSFATCDDCLQHMGSHDLILYHAREAVANWYDNNEQLLSLKKLLNIVPVIILSDIDCPDSLTEMFENGARGFIPTGSTTLEQIIEIIGLVKVGGTFVPLSSLSLRSAKGQGQATTAMGVSSHQYTRSELAILDRLKLGKANKVIAHELGMSESTVKVHIGRIMKKLKVTNRTQIVCRAYALTIRFMPLLPATSTFLDLTAPISSF